jgi:hypothetical protein
VEAPYDAVPYPSHAFAQTHPDRLATQALLFGLEPAPLEACRVLELGCSDGGNLLPMALALPDARFVGIDNNAGAVGRGQQLVEKLGVRNLTLETASIEDFEPEPGGFDYVIAHGIYSWVPPAVRDSLMAACRRALAESGVAYVSYNALPGALVRDVLRDMALFHAGALPDTERRLAEARAFVSFLVAGWPEGSRFGEQVRWSAERLLEHSDIRLVHDDLAEVHRSFYFHEFAAHAAAHGLQFLAEADYHEMQVGFAAPEIAQTLLGVPDRLRREQYIDFLRGRMFRQTLLCRAEAAVDERLRPEIVARLAAAAPLNSNGVPDSEGRLVFEGPTGTQLVTDKPLIQRAFERLGKAWPAAIPVRDLIPDGADGAGLCEALLSGCAVGVVKLHVRPPGLVPKAGERPRASALTRHEAATGDTFSSLRHAVVKVENEFGRRVLMLLDGTRDRAALAAELRAAGDVPDDLEGEIERTLTYLARFALLER